MPIQNKTMLITYSDSLGNNLKDLYENLEKYFENKSWIFNHRF